MSPHMTKSSVVRLANPKDRLPRVDDDLEDLYLEMLTAERLSHFAMCCRI